MQQISKTKEETLTHRTPINVELAYIILVDKIKVIGKTALMRVFNETLSNQVTSEGPAIGPQSR